MTLICCPFQTSFGAYALSLKTAIEKRTGQTVQWIGTNCGCGDPMEQGRRFVVPKAQCDYFELPIVGDFRANQGLNRRAKSLVRDVFIPLRARRYASRSKRADVVHMQQILNAYGSKAVFAWLQQPSNATRIVTVHELDQDQLDFPQGNALYNLADAVIVHCEEMKQQLISLGVQQQKIHIVLYGAHWPATARENSREGIVFYGGHKLLSGKGVDTVFKAMSILKQQMAAAAPVLKIHGHYGSIPEAVLKLAAEAGVADKIVWLNHIPDEEIVRLYQESLLCVLPYTGSFGGLAASQAAACQLPVICTRKAGLPDYLGEMGIWVEDNNPQQLAERIVELLRDEPRRREIGAQLRKRAEAFLRWDVVAEQTLKIYEQSTREKRGLDSKQSEELTPAVA